MLTGNGKVLTGREGSRRCSQADRSQPTVEHRCTPMLHSCWSLIIDHLDQHAGRGNEDGDHEVVECDDKEMKIAMLPKLVRAR